MTQLSPTPPARLAADRWVLPIVLVLFAGSGCAALIYEIVWFQLLQLVIGSSAVFLPGLLATFLGGLCLRRRRARLSAGGVLPAAPVRHGDGQLCRRCGERNRGPACPRSGGLHAVFPPGRVPRGGRGSRGESDHGPPGDWAVRGLCPGGGG